MSTAGSILSASAVVFAGVRLARHGDVIAARTGWVAWYSGARDVSMKP
jgi:hypothetical protein